MHLTRAQLSWICYDMANAAFALIVRTVYAPLFFKDYSAAGMNPTLATSIWGMSAPAPDWRPDSSPHGSAASPTRTRDASVFSPPFSASESRRRSRSASPGGVMRG